MYSLIVQGLAAKKLQFKNHSGQEFRSLIESMTLNKSVLICSPYRIDLIYSSNSNLQTPIKKLWCKISDVPYCKKVSGSFLQASDEVGTFFNYFHSLKQLSFSPQIFKLYKNQFHKVVTQEPNHVIHKKLIDCAYYLSKKRNFKVLKRFLYTKSDFRFYKLIDPLEMAKKARSSYLIN